jgi:hypothetical protein
MTKHIDKIITGVIVAAETFALGYVIYQNVNNDKIVADLQTKNDRLSQEKSNLELSIQKLQKELSGKKSDKITKYRGMAIRVYSGIAAIDNPTGKTNIISQNHSSIINECDEEFVELKQVSGSSGVGGVTMYNRYGNETDIQYYCISIDDFIDSFEEAYEEQYQMNGDPLYKFTLSLRKNPIE